jgi:cytochrome P450
VVVPVTPALVAEVLLLRTNDFHKVQISDREPARVVFGRGLSLSEGDAWVRQRRRVQPAFSRHALDDYEARFLRHAAATRDRWRPDTVQAVDNDMMEVSLHIAVDTLLGTSITGQVDRVRKLMRICLGNISALNSVIENVLPPQIPTLRRRRFARAIAEMDEIIFNIIAQRRREPGGDLLSLLIQVADADEGQMTDRQLRDEAMTMFVAGHETTAVGLSWAWSLLAAHPEAQARLHAELDGVVGDRPIRVDDLPKLRFAEGVIKESLRLYPPAYVYARQTRQDVELGGYLVAAKTLVLNSPWLMHRDRHSFENALEFRPERWLDDLERRLPKGAYIPFGLGPRRCVGQAFAVSESVAVLATLAQRYRVEAIDAVTRRDVAMTLRPKRLPMRILARA